MNIDVLKKAVSSIWALCYRASQENLDHSQMARLNEACQTVMNEWDADDRCSGRAEMLAFDALRCGAMDRKKVTTSEQIMRDCDYLQRHLDSLA